MDKVLGIIAEYNPFHNGHLYHLNESKKKLNCNFTICVINGNFTQRGNCSIIDKWSRTKIALLNGIDLVIELPLIYSISSAENFAYGGIKILDSLNIVDYLSFGSECPNISILNDISNILVNEPVKYKEILTNELNKGLSYPKSRENALINFLDFKNNNYKKILSSPNNILAIEYLKSLKKLNSKIIPFSLKRTSNYHSNDINKNITSGTAIRNIINQNNQSLLKKVVPKTTFDILYKKISNKETISNIDEYSKIILYNLRKMSIEEISNLADVNEGLEFLIKKSSLICSSVSELINMVTSKRYTKTRIQRILLYSLFNIKKEDILNSKIINPYIRILGFNDNGKKLLSKISKSNPNLNIITSIKKFENNCSNTDIKNMFSKDILSTNIYTLGYKNNCNGNLDYTTNIIKI